MKRRRGAPPDMTSLFDVLFILVFVSLVNAALNRQETADARAETAAVKASSSASAAAPPPSASASVPPSALPPPPAARELRERAIADLDARPAIIVRVSDNGILRSIDQGQSQTGMTIPLTEEVPEEDIALVYVGDRKPERRICSVVATHLETSDLTPYLIIITTDVPLTELTKALVTGLRADAERCLAEQRGVAIVVDPAATALPPRESQPPPSPTTP